MPITTAPTRPGAMSSRRPRRSGAASPREGRSISIIPSTRRTKTKPRFRERRCFPDMLAFAAGVFAILLLAATAQDSFEVMLLPRRVLRRLRFVSLFYRVTWAGVVGGDRAPDRRPPRPISRGLRRPLDGAAVQPVDCRPDARLRAVAVGGRGQRRGDPAADARRATIHEWRHLFYARLRRSGAA